MTDKDKILNKHLTNNGFEEYVNYKSGFWETIIDAMEEYKQLHIPVVVGTCCDNRTQEEKDMKRIWDEGETFR